MPAASAEPSMIRDVDKETLYGYVYGVSGPGKFFSGCMPNRSRSPSAEFV